jgi:hypothetical protein
MKKVFSLAAMLLFLSAAVFAQTAPSTNAKSDRVGMKQYTVEERATLIIERLHKKIANITPEQDAKLAVVAKSLAEEQVAAEQIRDSDRKAYRERRQKLVDRANKELLPILTPEQQEAYRSANGSRYEGAVEKNGQKK